MLKPLSEVERVLCIKSNVLSVDNLTHLQTTGTMFAFITMSNLFEIIGFLFFVLDQIKSFIEEKKKRFAILQ